MESLRTRCQVLTAVFVAILVVSALAALSDLSLLQYLQEISSGGPVDEARAERIDARQAMMGMVQVGLFVTCAIVFLMWFHRAHKNLKAGGLNDLRYTPGWAVGGFFVPFLNLVRPFQVMKEVWIGSAHLSRDVKAESSRAVSPAPHVRWWWVLFLISSFLGNASGRLMFRAGELGGLLAAGWATLASDLMDIPAALVALFLVRRVTDLQEQARTHLRTTGQVTAPRAAADAGAVRPILPGVRTGHDYACRVEGGLMKYRILGWIGIVWGALVVLIAVRRLLSGGIEGSAEGAGRLAGLVFGGLLVFAGIRALRKKPPRKPEYHNH